MVCDLLIECIILTKLKTFLHVNENRMPTRNIFRPNKKSEFSSEVSHNLLFCIKNLVLSKIK